MLSTPLHRLGLIVLAASASACQCARTLDLPYPCRDDSDCVAPHVCAAGLCGARDAAVDVDAGSSDAGSSDAGSSDAGPADAGPADGGCKPSSATERACGDGVDDDCDGELDCGDGDCRGEVCRPSRGPCDPPELCGPTTACPRDVLAVGDACDDGDVCTTADACDDAGSCIGRRESLARVECVNSRGARLIGTGPCDGTGFCGLSDAGLLFRDVPGVTTSLISQYSRKLDLDGGCGSANWDVCADFYVGPPPADQCGSNVVLAYVLEDPIDAGGVVPVYQYVDSLTGNAFRSLRAAAPPGSTRMPAQAVFFACPP